jgi:hypothetical protein
MTCPNGDTNFNKTLEKILGHYPTPNDRITIYYTVCIFLRISIASLLFICRDRPWIPYLFLTGSLIAIINYSNSDLNGQQWWSKRFQYLIAILIFIVSTMSLSFNNVNTLILPLLFFASIFGGLLQSFLIKKC